MARIVVVTGAGASYDCVSEPAGPPPPLTKDLFAERYAVILDRYPLVRQAAGDIRNAMRQTGEDAIALEDFLRERMAASSSPYTQRRYRQVPLYLQEVLSSASRYTAEPDNYNVLVNAALETDEALFLTLNYDILLDGRFAEYHALNDLDGYVDAERWSLVKLHGSVNWGWPLELLEMHSSLSRGGLDTANQVIDDYAIAGFPQFDNDEIALRPQDDLASRRWETSEMAAIYYPALAVPLGSADELVCPSKHVDAARHSLDRMDGLNLLVIGYSGLDQEVLGLFKESGNSIRRMLVANGEGMGQPAAERIAGAFGQKTLPDEWASQHGFSTLVQSGDLHRWMNEAAGSQM
jgi:hypothetical protein